MRTSLGYYRYFSGDENPFSSSYFSEYKNEYGFFDKKMPRFTNFTLDKSKESLFNYVGYDCPCRFYVVEPSIFFQLQDELKKKNLYIIFEVCKYLRMCRLEERQLYFYHRIILHCDDKLLSDSEKVELYGLQLRSIEFQLLGDCKKNTDETDKYYIKLKLKNLKKEIIKKEIKEREKQLIEKYEKEILRIKEKYENNGINKEPIKQNNEINESIKQNNEIKKDFSLCTICMNNQKNILFLPCKHCCSCKECSEQIKECCICREQIKEKIAIYI
jgi:hypothetical protein